MGTKLMTLDLSIAPDPAWTRVYTIGLSFWHHRSEFTQRLGCELMDLAEAQLGPISSRPAKSRRIPSVPTSET